MRSVLLVIAVVLFAGSCAPDGPDATPPGTAITSTVLTEAEGRTVLDQLIRYPGTGAAAITAAIIEIPPGVETGWHLHEVPLVAYVMEGDLTVTYDTEDGEIEKRYAAGDAVLEAIDTRHNGRNDGDRPVRLIAVYIGADGSANTVTF